jgi:hypothetical protein
MAEINDLNITDASNTARFPEAMAPSAVNDGARALEGLVARWHENINTSIATTGSANAYVLAAKGTQVLFDGLVIGFDANFANTGAATLNVDATGVKNILKHNDVALASGDIEANQKVIVVYDGTSWQMLSPLGNVSLVVDDTTPQLGGFLDANSKFISHSQGANIASVAGDTNIWTNFDGNTVHITGTNAITDFGTPKSAGDSMWVIFDAAASVVDSATITVAGNTNYQAAANDLALVYALTTSTFLFTPFPNSGSSPVAVASGAITQNAIAGLILSKSGADTLTIAAGSARDTGDAATMELAAFTKDVSASWAVGTGNGSLDTGSYATTTTYAVWLIQRSDTSVVDVLTSTSFTGPTMPTNYDRKRLIGYFVTDGTPDIIAFTQSGDYFRMTGDIIQDVTDTTITDATFEAAALSVPPNCLAHIYGQWLNSTMTQLAMRLTIRTAGAADALAADEAFVTVSSASAPNAGGGIGFVLVDGSSQVEYATREASGASTVTIFTIGCLMLTRRDT